MSDRNDPRFSTYQAIADELRGKLPMELTLEPATAFQLIGLLQLAGRHPGLTEALRATIGDFVSAAREYFADCPQVLDVIRQGEDPAHDLKWERDRLM